MATLPLTDERRPGRIEGGSPAFPAVSPRTLLAGIVALAAVLRFVALGAMQPNPYYDAAVRSMGSSWHAFFVAAFDPNATLASDKPPVGLWLQVISTKVLGFTPFALHLPEALASTVAVVLLYDLVRRGFGRAAGLAAAVALAVLPMEVMTGRSDTMDSVMMALLVFAAWLIVRAIEKGRARELYAAVVVVGLAFETKLFEALIPVPALALLFLLGSRTAPARRIGQLLGAGVMMAGVALAWPVIFSAIPAASRPYPIGSTNGSIWNTIFVWNGFGRLSAAGSGDTAGLLGVSVIAALVFAAVALVAGVVARRRAGRLTFALGASFVAWLLIGVAVLSSMRQMSIRYMEPINPAIAAVLGIGVVFAARAVVTLLHRRSSARVPGSLAGAVAAIVLVALLAVPAAQSISIVRAHTGDGGADGAMPQRELTSLSRYLTRHRGHTRYEFAAIEAYQAGPLIAADDQPSLVMASSPYHPLVSTRGLGQAVRAGQVRYVFVAARGSRGGGVARTHRQRMIAWVRAHGTDVTRAAGLHLSGVLFRLDARTLGGG
jgi:hypothetical protein